MKSFRQFLLEAPVEIDPLYNHFLADWSPFSDKDNKHGHKLGEFKGHVIQGYHHGELFQAVNPKTGLTAIEVRGRPMGGGFAISRLSGAVKSEIHGDEFYAHLLRQGHINALYSDTRLTPRSMNVWKRLAQNHPDIQVTRYPTDGRREMPLDPDWENNFGDREVHFKAVLK